MGHISNPTDLRLGLSRAWQVKIASPRYNYQEDLYNQLTIFMRAFLGTRRMERKAIIYSHTVFGYTTFKRFFATIFLYDARFELLLANFITKFFRGMFKARAQQLRIIRGTPRKIKGPLRDVVYPDYRRRIYYCLRSFLYSASRNMWLPLVTDRIEQCASLNFKSPNCLNIDIYPFSNSTLTAKTIGIYAVRKLNAKNSLNSIFRPIMRHISILYIGLRVICRGRFTRNQRATLSVYNYGSTKLSTFSSDIDYYHASTPLKYGVGSLKIWINHGFRNKGSTVNSTSYKYL